MMYVCTCVEVGLGLPKSKPSWICRQRSIGRCIRPKFSRVRGTLPLLPDGWLNSYDQFANKWWQLGSEAWKTTYTNASSSYVTLSEGLVDGSYKVRVRAAGDVGWSLYTTALWFLLLSEAEGIRNNCNLFSEKWVMGKVRCRYVWLVELRLIGQCVMCLFFRNR